MDINWGLMTITLITVVAYTFVFFKNREKVFLALKKVKSTIWKMLPLFFLAILFTSELEFLINPESIKTYYGLTAGQIGLLGVLYGTLLGFPLPGPRYAIYPLARFFLQNDASIGSVGSMIASQQLIDVPDGMFMEIKFMKYRYFISTLTNAFIISFLAGLITNLFVYGVFIPSGWIWNIPEMI